MSWDGRQHKQPVVRYELTGEVEGIQLVWRLTLPCGHTVRRAGGRTAKLGQYGAVRINGGLYICVPRSVACDVCRDGRLSVSSPVNDQQKRQEGE